MRITTIFAAVAALVGFGCGDDTASSTGAGGNGGGGGAGATTTADGTTTGATTSATTGNTTSGTTTTSGGDGGGGVGGGGVGGGGVGGGGVGGGGVGGGGVDAAAYCEDDIVLPPDAPPSGGACVTLGDTVECNPVTGEPCDTEAGETCDASADGYVCYEANTETLCDSCNATDLFCQNGMTCPEYWSLDIDYGVPSQCARFCCDDSDCGAGGVCVQVDFAIEAAPVGVCLTADPT